MFAGLSVGDELTLYFTKATSRPDVSSSTALGQVFTISPVLATVLRAQWLSGGDEWIPAAAERLVVTFIGNITTDVTQTLVSAVTVSLAPNAVYDSGKLSGPAVAGNMLINGTWGIASQPMFMVGIGATALDYGQQEGVVAVTILVARMPTMRRNTAVIPRHVPLCNLCVVALSPFFSA